MDDIKFKFVPKFFIPLNITNISQFKNSSVRDPKIHRNRLIDIRLAAAQHFVRWK